MWWGEAGHRPLTNQGAALTIATALLYFWNLLKVNIIIKNNIWILNIKFYKMFDIKIINFDI